MKFKAMISRPTFWLATCALLWASTANPCRAAAGYQLGKGKNIGPVNLAGYSNLQTDLPRGAANDLTLDLSGFVSGHFGRYANPFAELEGDDLTIAHQPGASNTSRFRVERLYNDFYLRPSTMLRLGKMLTPVGEWNLTHAPPLVWTVTRPLATYYSFPEFLSGAALRCQWNLAGMWDAQLYAQPAGSAFWNPGDYSLRRYSRVAGGNIRYSWDILLRNRIGFSWQIAHLPQTDQEQRLISIYGGFTTGPVQWSFQANLAHIQGGTTPLPHRWEHGGYVQAVYAVNQRWFVVAQVEGYQTRAFQSPTHRQLLGIVYRPQPAMSWKLDFLHAGGAPIGAPSGVYAAWAVLF